MKLTEMKYEAESREDVIGFLHHSDITKLNEIFNEWYTVNQKSYTSICDKTIFLYESKALSNKKASLIFKILTDSNKMYRVESHRHDNCGSIYRYDINSGHYIFLKKGSVTEFNRLNHFI